MSNLNELVPEWDAEKVEPAGAFEALPAGEYDVVIVRSETKPTKSGAGRYLELQLQVASGIHQNRVLFDRLNLVNPNEQAVQIAKATLSAICRALSVLTPKESGELHSKPLVAVVSQKKRADTGEMTNEVKGYKPSKLKQTVAELDAQVAAAPADDIPF